MKKLTSSKGIIIIIAFAISVFSCINVVIQGEGDLSGINDDLRAISIVEIGDLGFGICVFGARYYLHLPPAFPEAWGQAKSAIRDLARDMAASVRQSIGSLKNHQLR
jgi:hypothetical protein